MIEAKSPSSSDVLTPEPVVRETAALMRLLGDPTRIRLIGLLRDGERHVTDLCSHLDIAQPTVSHHLGLLRGAGLLRSRRCGKQIHYSLNPELITSGPQGLRVTCGTIEVRLGGFAPLAAAPAGSTEPPVAGPVPSEPAGIG